MVAELNRLVPTNTRFNREITRLSTTTWTLIQGSVAERSKALVLGTSPFGGVGSNPTAASFTNYEKPVKFLRKNILNGFWSGEEYNRSWQDSNLRSQRESDFKSDALTARPQLLYINICRLFDKIVTLAEIWPKIWPNTTALRIFCRTIEDVDSRFRLPTSTH